MREPEVLWKVVPISQYQKLDVRESDLLNGGDFRKCDTYRGGGGYDQFPAICERRLGIPDMSQQFVAQLYGCNLDCPYCYVTRSGVWGAWKPYTSDDLMRAFIESPQDVFHLMGGAPALYLDDWLELVKRLPNYAVFHSDFLLTEHLYPRAVLEALAKHDRCLFTVDIKGITDSNYRANTRKPFKGELFWTNLGLLRDTGVNFYLTFTNPDMEYYDMFCDTFAKKFGPSILDDAFTINLVDYDATPYVDIRPAPVGVSA